MILALIHVFTIYKNYINLDFGGLLLFIIIPIILYIGIIININLKQKS
jgi:hypothetical protein